MTMVTLVGWTLVLVCLTSLTLGGTGKSLEICTSASSTNVTIECPPSSRIHVISIRYTNGTTSCSMRGDCEVLLANSSGGLISDCDGVSTCVQEFGDYRLVKKCGNVSSFFATVSYECISDTDVNICSPITSSGGTLYLAAPNYPRDNGNDNTTGSCVCHVTGTKMSVEILEIYFRYLSTRNKANLTLESGDYTWMTHNKSYVHLGYNQVVMHDVDNLTIMFDAYGLRSQDLWMRIIGTSQLQVTCNGGTPTTPYTQPTPHTGSSQPVDTPTTPAAVTSTNDKLTTIVPPTSGKVKDTEPSSNVPIIVGCIVAVIVVGIIVVIIVMLRRKRMGPFQETEKRLYDASRRDKEDEAYEMPSYVLDVSDIKSADKNGRHFDPPYIDVETGNPIDLDSLEPADSPYSEVRPTISTQKIPRPPSPAYAEPISNGFRRDKLIDRIPYTEIKPGNAVPTDTGPPVYSDPIVLVQINTDSANGPPSSTPYAEIQAGAVGSSRPVSSPYAELEFPNTSEPNVSSDSPGGTGNSLESDTKETTLPLTSERLEQLYAKVVPKKFHSTKEMREEEKRTREMAKQKEVSSTGEQREENPRQEDAAKSKRPSSNVYHEIGEITPHNGKKPTTPPVPPKLEHFLDDQTEKTTAKTTAKTSQKKSKDSKKGKAFKILSKMKKQKDVEKSPRRENIDDSLVKDVKERRGERVEANANSGKNGRAMVDDNQPEDMVMIDNVLYEGGPALHQHTTPENSNHPTPDSLKYPEHAPESDVLPRPQSNQYETVKDSDNVPDVPLATSGIQNIRPVPYEGITLV